MQTLVIGSTRLSGGEPMLGVGGVTLEVSCFPSNPSTATARYVITVYRIAVSGAFYLASLLPLQITVTSHPASSTPTSSELQQEWRVLRFNDTRQSVSRVSLSPNWLVPQADAACLAFEYLKTMASAGQAAAAVHQQQHQPFLSCRILQIRWQNSSDLECVHEHQN